MAEASSKVRGGPSILVQALVLAAVSASAAEPAREWSVAAFSVARERDRPVLALVADGTAAETGGAVWPADPVVADRIAREFVAVQADRVLRPDLVDELGLAVRELGGGDGLPLLVALTPDGRPFAGRAGAAALDPAAFGRFADDALAGYRAARSGLDPRANAALEAVRAAQQPSKALRPFDAATVEAATRATVASPELDRAEGAPPHAAILLLLTEYRRTRRPELLKLATTALDLRLARAPSPADAPVAEQALAIEMWARAHDVAGREAYGVEAARLASRFVVRRRADGCFVESEGDARVLARTNGLAIGALALVGRIAGRPSDVDAARSSATAVLPRLGAPASLARADGAPAGSAFLEDYAALTAGLLELYEATGEPRWRSEAQALADAALGRFLDVEGGGFFLTDAAHDPLPARLRHAFDGATPSANGTMALALLHLSRATAEPRYAALARGTVDAFLGDLQRAPRPLSTLARAAVEIVGPPPASVAESATPSVVTHGPVTLSAPGPGAPVRAGGRVELAVELQVAPGAFVVAHGVSARDLAGFGVSVPFKGSRGATPRYPPAQARTFSWSRDPVGVYEGRTVVPVSVVLARDLAPGPQRARVRVVFQACDASGCRPPDSATLEVTLTVAGS